MGEGIYKIGSFNMRNIGVGAFSNERDLQTIANIILGEKFDVIALQEVLSEGKIFIKEDLPSRIVKSNIIQYLGGKDHWGFEWAYSGDESIRHEGYAFLWNKDRLDLSSSMVTKNGTTFKRYFMPRMIKINHDDMERQPYFARFTPQGKPGGSNFEIRLICVHTYFGKDTEADRNQRKKEINSLLTDIYPQIADKNYQNSLPKYTILLGDYNAELVTDENRVAYGNLTNYRKGKMKLPDKMETDGSGNMYSSRYGVTVTTVQDQLTTLKRKENTENEEYFDRGYASNYDHFSYDQSSISHVLNGRPKRIDAVRKYCGDDFEKYFKTVSDHIPISLEIRIN